MKVEGVYEDCCVDFILMLVYEIFSSVLGLSLSRRESILSNS